MRDLCTFPCRRPVDPRRAVDFVTRGTRGSSRALVRRALRAASAHPPGIVYVGLDRFRAWTPCSARRGATPFSTSSNGISAAFDDHVMLSGSVVRTSRSSTPTRRPQHRESGSQSSARLRADRMRCGSKVPTGYRSDGEPQRLRGCPTTIESINLLREEGLPVEACRRRSQTCRRRLSALPLDDGVPARQALRRTNRKDGAAALLPDSQNETPAQVLPSFSPPSAGALTTPRCADCSIWQQCSSARRNINWMRAPTTTSGHRYACSHGPRLASTRHRRPRVPVVVEPLGPSKYVKVSAFALRARARAQALQPLDDDTSLRAPRSPSTISSPDLPVQPPNLGAIPDTTTSRSRSTTCAPGIHDFRTCGRTPSVDDEDRSLVCHRHVTVARRPVIIEEAVTRLSYTRSRS